MQRKGEHAIHGYGLPFLNDATVRFGRSRKVLLSMLSNVGVLNELKTFANNS